MCPGFDSRTWRHVWAECVVGSLLCSGRFFSGYSGFSLSSKTNISKFQFDPGMHEHFWASSCELLGAPWVNKLYFNLLPLLLLIIDFYISAEFSRLEAPQIFHLLRNVELRMKHLKVK